MVSKIDASLRPAPRPLLGGGRAVGDQRPAAVDQAGGVALGRHPQPHHRPLAQRDRGPRSFGRSSPTSSSWRPPSWRPPVCPSRPWLTASSSRRWRHQRALQFSAPDAAERHDLQFLRCSPTAVYHQGWSAVTNHRTPWDGRRFTPRVRRRRVGATTAAPTSVRPVTSRTRPRQAPAAAAAVAHRSHQVNVAAHGRPHLRTLEPTMAGRAALSGGARSCATPAWAGCPRTAWSASRTSRSRSPPRSTSHRVGRTA